LLVQSADRTIRAFDVYRAPELWCPMPPAACASLGGWTHHALNRGRAHARGLHKPHNRAQTLRSSEAIRPPRRSAAARCPRSPADQRYPRSKASAAPERWPRPGRALGTPWMVIMWKAGPYLTMVGQSRGDQAIGRPMSQTMLLRSPHRGRLRAEIHRSAAWSSIVLVRSSGSMGLVPIGQLAE
jgi:hypothetical protein